MFPDIGRTFLEQRAAGTLQPESLMPFERRQNKDMNAGATTATEFVVDVHGESYQVAITGVGIKGTGKRHFYMTIDGSPEEVVFESLNEYKAESKTGRKQASKDGHVTTSMPGNIVAVLVQEGDVVTAGQPVLVTEAMKMEAEVQAPIAGKVIGIYVAKGDRVTPGEVLIEIGDA
jgi:pyruvate carboxylase subunit B